MTRTGVLVFVLVCALIGGLFYALLEPHSETVQGPLRGEAARNPYLAIARMLEAMGLPVTVKDDLGQVDSLPPGDSTLILLGPRDYVTESRSAELRDWVERGGHLVVSAWSRENATPRRADPLLDALGVRMYAPRESDGRDDLEEPANEANASPEPKAAELARWSPEPGVDLRIEFDASRSLGFEAGGDPVETWFDDAGDHGYSLALGSGHLTVWSDDDFLRNEGIGRWDHAQLGYRLVRMFDQSGATWIVIHGAERRELWSRIVEGAWSVCIALGCWVVFYLWSHAPRFGPIQPDPPAERRELMEHVRASGSFLLRNGGFDTLVNAVRAALLRRVQQRHPSWMQLAGRARAERVAEQTGLGADEIEAALESAVSTERDGLVKRIAMLEAIRKRL